MTPTLSISSSVPITKLTVSASLTDLLLPQSRMDSFNRHDYGDEDWVDDFHDEDDDHVEEYLPTPQHLGMDN